MFERSRRLSELAELLGATVEGDGSREVSALAGIDEATPGTLTFATDAKRIARLANCQAEGAIVPAGEALPEDLGPLTLLKVEDVQMALISLLQAVAPPEDLPQAGVEASASIDPSARVDASVAIGPFVRIGPGAVIEAGCRLAANVNVGANVRLGKECVLAEGAVIRYGSVLGERVRIGPNSVIGHDGFGYHFKGGVHHKVPHVGNVVIEDDVEVGACACIDRAKWGSTRIGQGAKIDNLVQIAHNVQVQPGAVMAALVGVAGSAQIGRFAVLGGHVGVRDNIEVGDGTTIGACSCLAQSTPGGETLFGIPAKDARTKMRELSAQAKLPDLMKRVRQLEKRISDSGAATNDQE
jgi:UDP-3-O-[3-hydroxymyristoyl] glucosamine N-acyltransferase